MNARIKAIATFTFRFRYLIKYILHGLAVTYVISMAALAGNPLPNSPFDIPQGAYRAEFVEDIDNVAVMSFTGDFDKTLPNGDFNMAARAVVAQEFYQHHPDEYDFLVMFSSFEYETQDALAFFSPVQNQIQGIGVPIFSNADLYGSDNLQGTIDMAALSRWDLDPYSVDLDDLTAGYNFTLNVLAHEVLHRWAVITSVPEMQGRDNAHWSFFLNTGASVEYGHDWQDNQNGSFTARAARMFYSPYDLYLMGLLAPDEVPDTFAIVPETNEFSSTDLPRPGITVKGQRKNISINDLIASNGGERIPSVQDSQKTFKFAFIYLTPNGSVVDRGEVAKINLLKNRFADRFSVLTGGKAQAQVHLSDIVDESKGIYETIDQGEIRPDAAKVVDAVNWLRDAQLLSGEWQDKQSTAMRDTLIVTQALGAVDEQFDFNTANQWILDQPLTNVDSLSRRIKSRRTHDVDRQALLDLRNADGGWGLTSALRSNALDTALAICALRNSAADSIEEADFTAALELIVDKQNADGGWGFINSSKSSVAATNEILQALMVNGLAESIPAGVMNQALAWLVSQQNVDDGFGSPQSTINETAQTILTFFISERLTSIRLNAAIDFLRARQAINGSWENSVYKTALAMQALNAIDLPNLNLSLFSASPSELLEGARTELTLKVVNDSSLTTPATIVKLYPSDPQSNAVTEYSSITVPALPAFSSIILRDFWDSLGAIGEQHLFAVVDGENSIFERAENDNVQNVTVVVAPAPDGVELEISPQDFVIQPQLTNELPSNLAISAVVRNIGKAAATNVHVQLWKGHANAGGQLLETRDLSIAAISSTGLNFIHSLEETGKTEFTVIVDANHQFAEINENNNVATASAETIDANDLEVLASEIVVSPERIFVSQDAEFNIKISNKGTVSAANVNIEFAIVNDNGKQILNTVTSSFAPGEERQFTSIWLANYEGNSNFVVSVDANNLLVETNEDNNVASVAIVAESVVGNNVAVNFKDIQFNPNPALEGFGVAIKSVLYNNGTTDLSNIHFDFYDGDPLTTGQLISSRIIPQLDSGSSIAVETLWPVVPDDQEHVVYVLADANSAITETSEVDNLAFTSLTVQSLPDFEVASQSIVTQPEYPRIGEPFNVTIEVANSGKQSADGVLVRVWDGEPDNGSLLLESTISVPSAAQQTLSLSHQFDTEGDNQLSVEVNPQRSTLESRYDNNSTSRIFNIQNGDFYVSNRFLSPDGNGVKDDIEYVFNLEQASIANVVVLDSRNREIRRFDISSEPVTSGAVVWDGKNVLGGIVADGTYRFAVQLSNEQYVGETELVLDTNRSSLSEALTSDYAIKRNLSCSIGKTTAYPSSLSYLKDPATSNLVYGPNDEFVYFTTQFEPYTDNNGQLVTRDEVTFFPTGLYRASVDGLEVNQLLSRDQFNFDLLHSVLVSPNSTDIVLVSYQREFSPQRTVYEFWKLTLDSNELELIHELEFPNRATTLNNIQFLDNQTLVYIQHDSASGNQQDVLNRLSVNVGAIPEFIAQVDYTDSFSSTEKFSISPNGQHALWLTGASLDLQRSPINNSFANEIVLADLESTLYVVEFQTKSLEVVTQDVTDVAWSPLSDLYAVGSLEGLELRQLDNSLFKLYSLSEEAFAHFTDEDNIAFDTLIARAGNVLNSSVKGRIKNITWNPDGSELAFAFEDLVSAVLNFNKFELQSQDTLSSRYNANDGIYLASLLASDLSMVAHTLPINITRQIGEFSTELLTSQNSQPSQPFDLTFVDINSSLNQNDFPIFDDGLPIIEMGYSRLTRKFLWLPGAREILVTGGEHDKRNLSYLFPNDASGLRADETTYQQKVLLSLDEPSDDTRYIFEDIKLVEEEQFSSGDLHLQIYGRNTRRVLGWYEDNPSDLCPNNQESVGFRQFQSLLNLTADLRVRKSNKQGGILIDGTAADKHFSEYRLDYSDVNQPDTWLSIAPPSDSAVLDGRFTTWVPPYIGNFYVRLTVVDLAGNSRQRIKRITNTDAPSISGVFLQPAYFSPNGDGVKDQAELNFKILEPVNLSINIYNSANILVRQYARSEDLIGSEQKLVWDGRDQQGLLLPDDIYRVLIQDYEFFITLDNTLPNIIDLTNNIFLPNPDNDLENVIVDGEYNSFIKDNFFLEYAFLQRRSENADWSTIKEMDLAKDQLIFTPIRPNNDLLLNDIALYQYRFIAADLAGNIKIIPIADQKKRQRINIVELRPVELNDESKIQSIVLSDVQRVEFDPNFNPQGADLEIKPENAKALDVMGQTIAASAFSLVETVELPLQSISIDYKLSSSAEFQTVPVTGFYDVNAIDCSGLTCARQLNQLNDGEIGVYWDYQEFITAGQVLDMRFRFVDIEGSVYYSNPLMLITGFSLELILPSNTIPKNQESLRVQGELNRTFAEGQLISAQWSIQGGEDYPEKTLISSNPFITSTSDTTTLLFPEFANFSHQCGNIYTVELDVDTIFGQINVVRDVEIVCNALSVSVATPSTAGNSGMCNIPGTGVVNLSFVSEGNNSNDEVALLVGIPDGSDLGLSSILFNENTPARSFSWRLDISNYPEGDLKLRAVSIANDGLRRKLDFFVPVQRQLPTIDVTYPDNNRVCAVQYKPSLGEIYSEDEELFSRKGIEIQGVISTGGPALRYGLFADVPNNRPDPIVFENYQGDALARGNFEILFSETPSSLEESTAVVPRVVPTFFQNKQYFENNATALVALPSQRPITGLIETKGVLGIPIFEGSGQYEFTLQAENWSGGKSCKTFTIDVDAAVDGLIIEANAGVLLPHDKTGFSYQYPFYNPQSVSASDPKELSVNMVVDESVVVDVDIYSTQFFNISDDSSIDGQLYDCASGVCLTIDQRISSPIQTANFQAGRHSIEWDGLNDAGQIVDDGIYIAQFKIVDGCGNLTTQRVTFGLDNSAPEAVIDYPQQGDRVYVQAQIRGRVVDKHIAGWNLTATQDDATINIDTGDQNKESAILGVWDTFGLLGNWEINLSAQDKLGNQLATIEPLTLVQSNLISAHSPVDYFVSPNGDGRVDTLVVRTAFEEDVVADYFIVNKITRAEFPIIVNKAYPRGYATITWSGLNAVNVAYPDDIYEIKVVARLADDLNLEQTEVTDFEIDTVAPEIELNNLTDGFLQLAGQETFSLRIEDANLLSYRADIVAGNSITTPLEIFSGVESQAFLNATIPAEIIAQEGEYRLEFSAIDLASNQTKVLASMNVDTTPPLVEIETPLTQTVFNSSAPIEFIGQASDDYLQSYSVSFIPTGADDEPLFIAQGAESKQGVLGVWDTSALPDGDYDIELIAIDKSGLSSKATVTIKLDNTPPTVDLVDFGTYITEPLSIVGTANDENDFEYTLGLAVGQVSENAAFDVLIQSDTKVIDSTLFSWSTLPDDGNYTLQLLAKDIAGNSNSVLKTVTVDTTPPAPIELLSLEYDRDTELMNLKWAASSEPELAGYLVFRNQELITTDPITELEYTDTDLPDGEYRYHIIVVDLASLQSEISNVLNAFVDTTPPTVVISSPLTGSRVSTLVDINGTAHSETDFESYSVFAGTDENTLALVRTSNLPISVGELAQWNTLSLSDNQTYLIKVVATDVHGNEASDSIQVFIDNTPPAAPINLEAILNNEDVQSSWTQSGADNDINGYLLYRNDTLVNLSGPLVGDLSPYLIEKLNYLEANIPDGSHEYVVYAIDTTGNISEPSNIANVAIERRAPQALISNLEDNEKFADTLYLLASSIDEDVASVSLEYRIEGGTNWTPIILDDSLPFDTTWNATALIDGHYELRAVATDFGGLVDASPAIVNVIKQDLTPPSPINGLDVSTNGDIGSLLWLASDASDLAGYRVYRKCFLCDEVDYALLNNALLIDNHFTDDTIDFGAYTYKVTAVDQLDNESVQSDGVSALYFVTQLNAPSQITTSDEFALMVGHLAELDKVVDANGVNLLEGVLVDYTLTAPGGATAAKQLLLSTDINELPVLLNALSTAGKYTLDAHASSSDGKFQAVPATLDIIVSGKPSPVQNVTAQLRSIEDDIRVVWDESNAAELVGGYFVERNGEVITDDNYILPNTIGAIDGSGDPSQTGPNSSNAYWFHDGLSVAKLTHSWNDTQLVDYLEIDWRFTSANREAEIFAEINGEKIKVADTNNQLSIDQLVSRITLPVAVPTNSIEIRLPKLSSRLFTYINRVKIFPSKVFVADNTEFIDSARDNNFIYKIAAMNIYGGVGDLSEPSESIDIGDVTPPEPPILSGSLNQQLAQLSWDAVADATQYWLYRDGERIGETTQTSYADPLLVAGTYEYWLVAVDQADNPSVSSNRVLLDFIDTIDPLVPHIISPLDIEQGIYVETPSTMVIGVAEPFSRVFLVNNGVLSAIETSATGTHSLIEVPYVDNYTYYAGKQGQLLRTDFASIERFNADLNVGLGDWERLPGLDSIVSIGILDIQWTSANTALIVTYNNTVFVYDALSDKLSPVLFDQSSYSFQSLQAFDADSNQVILGLLNSTGATPGLYAVDIVTNTVTALPNDTLQSVSPNGQYVLSSSVTGLVTELDLYDIHSGLTKQIQLAEADAQTLLESEQLWSPDSERILINNGNLFQSYDISSDSMSNSVAKSLGEEGAFWFGNDAILYTDDISQQWLSYDFVTAVETERFLNSNNALNLDYAFNINSVLPNGRVLLKESAGNRYQQLALPGEFVFNEVPLTIGANNLSVISADSTNNISGSAAPVEVIYAVEDKADLIVAGQVNPQVPLLSKDASIDVVIENIGQLDASSATFKVTALTEDKVLYENALPTINSASTVRISVPWSPSIVGNHLILLDIDSNDQIDELNEANNQRILSINVVETALPSLNLQVNNSLNNNYNYTLDETIVINAAINNNGARFIGNSRIEIVDSNQNLVATLIDEALDLGYLEANVIDTNWVPNQILEGNYFIRATVYDDQGESVQVTEQAIKVLTDGTAQIELNTDRLEYEPSATAQLNVLLSNNSSNTILQNTSIKLVIRNVLDEIMFTETRPMPTLLTLDSTNANFAWDIANVVAGPYRVFASLESDNGNNGQPPIIVATEQLTVNVTEQVLLTGELINTLKEVAKGGTLFVEGVVQNISNVDLTAVELVYNISKDGVVVLSSRLADNDLIIGEAKTYADSFNLAAQSEGDYVLQMVAIMANGGQVNLTEQDFRIVERQAPNVTILRPTSGQVINQTRSLAQIQAEDESRVVAVEVRFDSQDWQNLSILTNQNAFYPVNLFALPDGVHTLYTRAEDANGNGSNIVSTQFIADSINPEIKLLNVANDELYANAVVPNITVEDVNLETVIYSLNNVEYIPGRSITVDGDHVLSVSATDKAGNFSQELITFSIDQSAPIITVDNLVDGQHYANSLTPNIVISDNNTYTVDELSLNGNAYSSGQVIDQEGRYELFISVTDKVGNNSQRRIEFSIDLTPPAITITGVTDGETYTMCVTPEISINGELNNQFSATILLNGQNYLAGTALCVNGDYTLLVNASDLAGNSAQTSVTFSINGLATTLQAADDELFVNRGAWRAINVLSNDQFDSLDDLTVELIKQPDNGSLIITGKGSYHYFPYVLFFGQDSFVYRLRDSSGNVSDATVFMDVSPGSSCSSVPNHSTDNSKPVLLKNWAYARGDSSPSPRYRITILNVSNTTVFVTGQTPKIDFPNCSLSYTAKPGKRTNVTVEYRVKDVAANGSRYTSRVKTFTLSIDTSKEKNSSTVLVPIYQLLLLGE